jgi:putative peptidoglycan lipid II flippase
MTGAAEWPGAQSPEDVTVVLPAVRDDDADISDRTPGPVPAEAPPPPGPATADAPPSGPATADAPASGRATAEVPSPIPASTPDGGGRHRADNAPTFTQTADSVARNSAVMAAGSMVSRVTGLLRTAAIGAAIGSLAVADDYTLAITLPSMVYELLVGGVLSSVIVPVLVRARRRDDDGGQAYAQRLLSLAAICLAAATLLAVASAPVMTAILANHRTVPADRDLITNLARLILPTIFFYGMAALFGALLNTRGHFAAPGWVPILNNLVVIATAGTFMLLPTVTRPPHPESITVYQLLVLGLGTTLGIVVQTAGLWPALRRVGFRWKWRFDFRKLGLGELGRMSAWMLMFVVVSQAGVLAVFNIAKRAGDHAGPGPAIFNNAFLIFMMAHGIVAVSIITALMPRMSAAAADARHRDLTAQLSTGIRLSAVILIPTTLAYLVLGRPLAVTILDWRDYGHGRALATGTVIAVAGLGLIPYAVMQLQQFAFFALRDTRTPALINIPIVALRVGVDVVFYLLLPAASVAAALMGGSTISFVVGALVSFWLLRRRLGLLGMAQVVTVLIRLAIAAVLAAVPAFLIVYGLLHTMGDGKIASLLQLVVGGVALLAGYLALAHVLRVREVSELITMIRGRLGR